MLINKNNKIFIFTFLHLFIKKNKQTYLYLFFINYFTTYFFYIFQEYFFANFFFNSILNFKKLKKINVYNLTNIYKKHYFIFKNNQILLLLNNNLKKYNYLLSQKFIKKNYLEIKKTSPLSSFLFFHFFKHSIFSKYLIFFFNF